MSWWERSSPVQFAKMSPRARMLAGLSGLGMGSSGVEVNNSRHGALLQLTTKQSVAIPGMARAAAGQQMRPQLPLQFRGFGRGEGITLEPAPTAAPAPAPTSTSLAPSTGFTFQPLPSSGGGFAPATSEPTSTNVFTQSAPSTATTPLTNIAPTTTWGTQAPVTQVQTAPVASDSSGGYAKGTTGMPDLAPIDPDAGYYSDAAPPSPSNQGTSTSVPAQKALTPAAAVAASLAPKASAGMLGVPTWVWAVGGGAIALVVLYKLASK